MHRIAMFLVLSTTAMADPLFTVGWGKGDGEIGFFNPSSEATVDQPYAEGPGGIASGPKGEIWISDTFGDRILRFDSKGAHVGTITELKGQSLSRPQTLSIGNSQLAVICGQSSRILWLNSRSGEIRTITKGPDDSPLLQPETLAFQEDNLWVGDFGTSRSLRYGKDSARLENLPWTLAGLAVSDGKLHSLAYDAQRRDSDLVELGASGEATPRFPLVAPELLNPYLVGIDGKGRVVVRFVKPGPDRKFLIVRYDENGERGTVLGEVALTVANGTIALHADGSVLALSYDAMNAPSGSVEIHRFD